MPQDIQTTLSEIVFKKFGVKIDAFRLESPPKKEMGDIAFPCFQLSKETKLAPPAIAQDLKNFIEEYKDEYPMIEKTDIAGPYLNITLSKKIYTEQFLSEFCPSVMLSGSETSSKSKKGMDPSLRSGGQEVAYFPPRDELIIVDYIGANVGKPLHIGLMCTPNIGQALINLYKKLGYKVIGDSHLGDWGIIFGKLLLAYKMWGDEKKLHSDAINYLLELYIKITEETKKESQTNGTVIPAKAGISGTLLGEKTESKGFSGQAGEGQSLEQQTRDEFKLLSEGNPDSIKLWENITRESIEFMQIQLDRLNVKPDYHIGESFYEGIGLPKMGDYPDLKYNMKEVVEEVIAKGIAKRNDDKSAGVEFEKMPSTILQKRDGTHGYLASDLATIKYRTTTWKNIKKMVYSVDVRQELHLQQVYDITRRAGWVDGIELFHASNGFISLKEGAMSTRTGKIIRLEALLDEAQERAKKIILEKRNDISGEELSTLAKTIGIGAIKYGYLSKSRTTNVVFDWDEFMTFEGNSGPYIQYAYVRGKSIMENLNYRFTQGTSPASQEGQISDASFELGEEIELVKAFLRYKEVLLDTADKNMPHILAGYIYDLTKVFNSFYTAVNIKNEENEGKKFLRLELVRVFCDIVKDGFNILGIDVPEKM